MSKVELKYNSSFSKTNGTTIHLMVFEHTELKPTSFIPIEELDLCFRYNITNTKLTLFYFDDEGYRKCREERYNLNVLINECAEVREFANKHYPEFVV